MSIADICIRRPVFTWVLVAIPAVLGVVSYGSLGLDLFPKVDFPVVAVTCQLPGASVEEMETGVAKVLEETINTVSGIDDLITTAREGSVTIVSQFVLEKDGNVAAQEIRDKLSGVMQRLPEGTKTPVVDKFDLDAAPVLTIAVSGRRDAREVTEIARRQIQEVLQTVNGVGAAFLSGGRTRAINVHLDTDKLTSYRLSAEEVRRAIIAQNLEVPGGLVDQGPRELMLRTLGRIQSPADFGRIIVANRKGFPIRVSDVGRVEDSIEIPRSLCKLDDNPAVSVFIQKQSGTNTVTVVDNILKRIEKIKPTLPADIRIETTQDMSRFIRRSIEELKFHLLLAGVLVSATILLFIRDWRTTVIATLAIPTSIAPTFLCMHWMGFTLNNITMLGLILAIGIVIDDAVVVHENIFRHMEEFGRDSFEAARLGTKEIALAVLATSLSLMVVFLPISFMGGLVGRFFSSFGLTVAFAVGMSLFVSMTLTPMLCSRFLKLEPGGGHKSSKSGAVWQSIEGSYLAMLRWSLRHRVLVCIGSILVVFSTVPLAMSLGANLVPRDDQSEMQAVIVLPEGYTLERAERVIGEIVSRFKSMPGVVKTFTSIGQGGRNAKGQGDVTKCNIYIRLKEIEDRSFSQFQVMARARELMKDFPDLRIAITDVQAIQAAGQDSRLFQMSLTGPDLKQLIEYGTDIKSKLIESGTLTDVDTSVSLRKPEVQVAIDRDRAADLGIDVDTIATTLNVLVGGQIVSNYKEGTEQYDVWLRADQPFRINPQLLDTFTIPTKNGQLVQLSAIVKMNEDLGPSQIDRYNRQRQIKIVGNPSETSSLNAAVTTAREIAAGLNMTAGYDITFLGQAKTMGETGYYFAIAFGLSVLFMYLIIAAQFESWIQPISILASLPVTIPFGLLSLVIFRQPIDLYSLFGLFMLVGIVKKNGILQVDKTNELRRGGMERDKAIIEANSVRLRPILMTTMMLVAAMIPIALGQGPGAAARASMAKVIIGGQMFSLVLALIVTPVVYSLLDGMSSSFSRLVNRLRTPRVDAVDRAEVPVFANHS